MGSVDGPVVMTGAAGRPDSSWHGLAKVLGVAAAGGALLGVGYGAFLVVNIAATDVALYRSHVGKRLLLVAAAASAVLAMGWVAQRLRLSESESSLERLAALAAAVSLALSVIGEVYAQLALRPSFAYETRALAQFAPPPGAREPRTTTETAATLKVDRRWQVPGSVGAVCAGAEQSFRQWAEPTSVSTQPNAPTGICSFSGRRGRDSVRLTATSLANRDYVDLHVALTRDR